MRNFHTEIAEDAKLLFVIISFSTFFLLVQKKEGLKKRDLQARVEITGLVDSSGNQKPLVYEVKFFWLEVSENTLRPESVPGEVKQMVIIGEKDGV